VIGSAFLFVSAALGLHTWTKQNVRDASDLSAIDGRLSSYSFKDGSRGRHYYIIRLFEYQAAFQIPADFVGSFLKKRFQADLKTPLK